MVGSFNNFWSLMKKLILLGMVGLMWAGCKPTEKNYRAAYDAAQAKREAAIKEQMLPATGMLSDDGPQLRIIGGDSVYVLQERVRLADSRRLPKKWAVAVGVYKMDTNAKSNAEALQGEGYKNAFVAKAPTAKYYTVTDCYMTLDSARVAGKEFRMKHKGYPYVGLPGAPVLLSY